MRKICFSFQTSLNFWLYWWSEEKCYQFFPIPILLIGPGNHSIRENLDVLCPFHYMAIFLLSLLGYCMPFPSTHVTADKYFCPCSHLRWVNLLHTDIDSGSDPAFLCHQITWGTRALWHSVSVCSDSPQLSPLLHLLMISPELTK